MEGDRSGKCLLLPVDLDGAGILKFLVSLFAASIIVNSSSLEPSRRAEQPMAVLSPRARGSIRTAKAARGSRCCWKAGGTWDAGYVAKRQMICSTKTETEHALQEGGGDRGVRGDCAHQTVRRDQQAAARNGVSTVILGPDGAVKSSASRTAGSVFTVAYQQQHRRPARET